MRKFEIVPADGVDPDEHCWAVTIYCTDGNEIVFDAYVDYEELDDNGDPFVRLEIEAG